MSNSEPIKISMLGGCSLTYKGNTIDGKNIRSKKIWILLEYLIIYRFRCVAQGELIDLIYPEERSSTPSGALKTLIHRAREVLGLLGCGEGKEIILKCAGGYRWNPELFLEIDTERFESLVREASVGVKDKEEQLKLRLDAIDLYKGDFLPEAATDIWAMSITTYYHFLFMNVVHSVITALVERSRYDDVVSVTGKAIAIDPYDESLYFNLILALANTNRIQAARTQYENMTKLFYGEFGISPSKELQAVYKKLVKSDNGVEKDLSVVGAQLCETKNEGGAFFCEYEFFRDIFRLEISSAAREGRPVHIYMINVEGKEGKPLSKKAQNSVMQKLCNCIKNNIRRGDVFSRYSVSQFIILLSLSSSETSERTLERIARRFRRDNPHSPAAITYSLRSIESDI